MKRPLWDWASHHPSAGKGEVGAEDDAVTPSSLLFLAEGREGSGGAERGDLMEEFERIGAEALRCSSLSLLLLLGH